MRGRFLAGATALTVLAAPAVAEADYRAEVRRTTGGWAHIKANDYGSLGFGYGYAYAQDQLCELAEIVVTVNAQRSRYFGPQDGNVESDFDQSSPKVLAALTGAVEDLRAKGIALDVPLGELQAEPRGSERIPIHGCSENEGCFNIITTDRDAQGRYDPRTGTSFVMTAAFDERGRVRGEAILSYSQSENPKSEHYADQTRLFSQKQWLPMRFTERSIRSDPSYERTVVTGRR